jgi:hypothetical protein
MCLLVCFLVMSGLLEVGQANYNKMEKECFSVGYQSLYWTKHWYVSYETLIYVSYICLNMILINLIIFKMQGGDDYEKKVQ